MDNTVVIFCFVFTILNNAEVVINSTGGGERLSYPSFVDAFKILVLAIPRRPLLKVVPLRVRFPKGGSTVFSRGPIQSIQ